MVSNWLWYFFKTLLKEGKPVDLRNRKSIHYKKSFCAFLDILGFEELVQSNSAQSKEKLEKYFGLIKYIQEYINEIDSKSGISILAISDSIVLSYEMTDNDQDNRERFKNFLIAICIIQSTLATYDIWLRGAVTVGNISFNPEENFIVGEGYIKSFKLEKIAKFPRVLIDISLVKELGFIYTQNLIDSINKKNEGGINLENWRSDLIFDWSKYSDLNDSFKQDIPLFLDSFSECFNDYNKLKEIIKHLSNNILTDIRHYEKYKWVLNYLIIKTKKERSSHATTEITSILNNLLMI